VSKTEDRIGVLVLRKLQRVEKSEPREFVAS